MRARRTDANHKSVLDAIRALGYPCMSLHAHGKGLEDILVGVVYLGEEFGDAWVLPRKAWVLIEVKVPNKSGTVKPSKFTPAQRDWYAQTAGFPRLIVTGAQDAVDQLRAMVG